MEAAVDSLIEEDHVVVDPRCVHIPTCDPLNRARFGEAERETMFHSSRSHLASALHQDLTLVPGT